MGQVARSMNPPSQGSSITSTTSRSGENSPTHSPDSTSNTMLMDKHTHNTSSENIMESLPQYDRAKQLAMDSAGESSDDVTRQTVPGNDRDPGNMSIEFWNEHRPDLLPYPDFQSRMVSPLPGIFQSLQIRDLDPQSLSATTTNGATTVRSHYNIPFDGGKNGDETVRTIYSAIDELAAMMNAHSLLSDCTITNNSNYPEGQHTEHLNNVNMESHIPTLTPTKPTYISHNKTPLLTLNYISSSTPPLPSTDQPSSKSMVTTTNTLPTKFQFSFASNPSQEPLTCNDQRTRTKHVSSHPPSNIHQRKILPLPKPRVQRTQSPPSTVSISSEFTFKPPYNPSAYSKPEKQDTDSNNKVFGSTNLHHSYGMNHETKDDNETPIDYTKKAKRSGDCYTDDDYEDGPGLVYRTCNRYNKITNSAMISTKMDRCHPLDSLQHSFLPSSLLQHSFLQPLSTGNNGSSKQPPSSASASLKSSSSSSHNKRNINKNKSTVSSSSLQTDISRKNSNNGNRTDTNRSTRGKQHSKQHQPPLSPSSSAATLGRTTPTSRRKGKQGPADNLHYLYPLGIKNDNSLDLVTSTLVGPSDWICLFCQYEIFKKGWLTAKRKVLVQEQRKRTLQRRPDHKSILPQQELQTRYPLKQQQIKDNRCDGGKEGGFGVARLDRNHVT